LSSSSSCCVVVTRTMIGNPRSPTTR